MNSTKFKFNGKFYKQKFGTPIGSVISPMLAEIVMEDLEKTVFERLEFVVPFYFRYVDDTLLCVPLDKLQTVIDTFNDYRPRIKFTHEMERNNRISFLDLEIIKLDNGKIVSNWYRKSTYSGRVLNFISNYPFQNKVAIIKYLVDRSACLSHESFHSENFDFVRKILFFNHYPQDLIEKHIKVRFQQIKSRKSKNVDTDTQSEIFDKNNTIVLPYFGQISKKIQSMLKKFQIHTIFRIPFGMEGLMTLGKDVLKD